MAPERRKFAIADKQQNQKTNKILKIVHHVYYNYLLSSLCVFHRFAIFCCVFSVVTCQQTMIRLYLNKLFMQMLQNLSLLTDTQGIQNHRELHLSTQNHSLQALEYSGPPPL